MNDKTKIAADLRHAADYPRDWMRRLDPRLGVPHNTLYEMMRVTGCFENHKSANPPMLFHRLADIVDPTCRIYLTDTSYNTPDTGYVSDGYYSCSHCHCEFGDYTSEVWDTYQASYYEGEPPFEFCPHCGARIIIDEPRKDDYAN